MKCQRCGHCCMAVGREFWLHGDYENKPQYPKLHELASKLKDTGDGLPCRMIVLYDGIATCQIHDIYGYNAKPKVCKNYPEFECHQQAKTFKGQGTCSQVAG